VIKSIEDNLIHAFHASNEGQKPFNPNELEQLKKLIEKKYVKVIACNRDSRSPHKAKSCKVKIAWLTKRGLAKSRRLILKKLDSKLTRLSNYLDNKPSRLRMIVLYMLTAQLNPAINYHKHYENTNILEEVLPGEVLQEYDKLINKMIELNLAAKASINHTTKGWKNPELTIANTIKERILKKYRQVSLPLIIDLAIVLYHAITIENKLINELAIHGYMETTKYTEYIIKNAANIKQLLTITSNLYTANIRYAQVNWKQILKAETKQLKTTKNIAIKILHGIATQGVLQASHTRLKTTKKLIKTLVTQWIKTGQILNLKMETNDWDTLTQKAHQKEMKQYVERQLKQQSNSITN